MGWERNIAAKKASKKEVERTVVFAVPSHPQPSRLDRGKAESNSLAQCRSIDVRNTILVADATIGKVEALTRDVAIRVRRVVRVEPG